MGNIHRINQEKPKDVNIYPVGLGNIRILSDCAPKTPWTLLMVKEVVAQSCVHLAYLILESVP
jgi:hypothetical protein